MPNSERGRYLWVSLSLVILTLTFVSSNAQLDNRYIDTRGQCNVNGNVYRHGQIFTIPGLSHCLKYRCASGGWDIYEEACQHNGICRPVGSSFEDACRTYTCTKTSRNNYSYYQATLVRTQCQDYYGACRQPGSQFPYAINGRVYQDCSCSTANNGYISYQCRG
ncbi:unnamed protein product [Candidula unifasciata]|uniref:Uncharacterized protein n=1 Tax=Candidula unifasciata TaxID=100452 RepID=A0A8S3YNN8_9EUPU|nr:unnamed protein product [Candidula unifasciata]